MLHIFMTGHASVQVYLTWIPLAYIFNTNLLEILLGLFPLPPFRNLALQCLTEIGSLPEVGEEHNEMFLLLFQHFMTALVQVLPPTLDIAQVRAAFLLQCSCFTPGVPSTRVFFCVWLSHARLHA
jgi:hypothetical protein